MTADSTTPETPQPARVEVAETPLEALASVCVVIALLLFVQGFLFQNFEIPSGSMEKTLLIGDHVVVDRVELAPPTKWVSWLLPYRAPRRGDIIVFLKPDPIATDPPDIILVKRCIAIPGDHIHLLHGVVYINGVQQNEPYARMPQNDADPYDAYEPYRDDFPAISPVAADDPNITALWATEMESHVQGGDLVVPPGHVFAMGDNRTHSLDGRFWGFVPDQNIMGRPLFVYWSFKTPSTEEDKTTIPDRIGFIFHIITHIFSGTRWERTFHVIR